MSAARNVTAWAMGLTALLAASAPEGVACQFEVGLGLALADTDQNAFGMVSTITWNITSTVALRGFADAEVAVPDFKQGLGYDEVTDRAYIVDLTDPQRARQRPEGDDLWEKSHWDAHLALYATYRAIPRVHIGPGLAYNGLDRTGTVSASVFFYATQRTGIGVELLDAFSISSSRWRLRVSLGFWRFP